MSFTDGKQRIATEQDVKAPWGGLKGGKKFRCKLCGHKFKAGDAWRWVFAKGKTFNFLVCTKCDTEDNDELIGKMLSLIEESKVRFWWLWDDLNDWIEESRRVGKGE